MISFGSPWLLLALLLVPAIVLAYRRAQSARAARLARLAQEGLVTTEATRRARFRRHLPFTLFTTALALLAVALARPSAELTLPQREGTLVIAIDVSNSMAAKDVTPTRIAAAKAAARTIVEQQPSTIKIGLVAFGGSAITVLRPTDVKKEALAAIDRLSVSGGTSLGQGLYTSLSTIAGKPLVFDEDALSSDGATVNIGFFPASAIVMLSDGENTERPDPVKLAELSSGAGVRIDTVGVGTDEGTTIEVDGFSVGTALNRGLLEQIADVTDGTFYDAAEPGTLAAIANSVDREFTRKRERREVTALFAAGAAALMVAASALSIAWFGRVI